MGPHKPLKLVVMGATGFIGRTLSAGAASKGILLLQIVRSSENAFRLGLEQFLVFRDLSAAKLIESGFESSVIVHLIGSTRDEPESPLHASIVESTEAIIEIAKTSRARRIIYLSGYGITHNSSECYFRFKAEAEAMIRASGMPYTVFRPSYILGPGDELTPNLLEQLLRGEVEIPGDGSYRFQPIYIKDLVDVIINAAKMEDDSSYSYDLLGPKMSFRTYVNVLRARYAPQAKVRYESLETFIRRATFSTDPIFTTAELSVLVCDLEGPVTESCLGVRIRAIEETIDDWAFQ